MCSQFWFYGTSNRQAFLHYITIWVTRGPLLVHPFDLGGSIGHDVALLHAEFGSPSPTAWGGNRPPK